MIKLVKSTFYKEPETKRRLIAFIRKAKQLSFGTECERFEREFSAWQGRRDFVLVNSGSSANLAIIQALLNLGRIKRGDNVGFSAVTWSTNVMPLVELGLRPVPVDVSLETLNISSRILRETVRKHKIRMLFLTNLLGFSGDIDSITALCKREKIILVEDNCESLGSVYKGRKLGNFSLASTFSFYVGHHMSTIEGGGVATDDEELGIMLRLVRAHGWDRNLSFVQQKEMRRKFRINSQFYSRYTFYDLGYNLRPTEITGFLGRIQLPYIDEIIQKRQKNFLTLAQVLYGNQASYYGIRYDHLDTVSNFAFPLIATSEKLKHELVKRCVRAVEIRPVVGGNMVMQPFYPRYNAQIYVSCPNAELIHKQGVYFGNNPDMTKKDITDLIAVFNR